MSNRKKPDARALFNQAKGRQQHNGGGIPTASLAARATERGAAGGVDKYEGKSREELLALLKMKQARAKTQKAAPPQPRVASPRAAQSRPSMLVRPVVVQARRPGTPKPSKVQPAGSSALTGLLGMEDDDSSGSDEDGGVNSQNRNRPEVDTGGETKSVSPASATRPTAAKPTAQADVPEGLPADFFDEAPARAGAETEAVPEQKGCENEAALLREDAAEIKRDSPAAVHAPPAPLSGRLDPVRAAQLEAEAAAQAEADEVRVKEAAARAVAAARAAGVVAVDRAAAGVTATEDDDDGDAGAAAPNGSALPEGFFDDPEVDAKTRGVDLKAKKKEQEQKEWKEFMMFAEEVKKTEKEEQQEEEEQEEDKEQYEELEQATMMGRLAMLMNKYESIGRKRKRPVGSSAVGLDQGEGEEKEAADDGSKFDKVVGGSSNEGVDAVELSVAKAGSAMREVAVASAPADAAATEIAAMLKRKNLKKKKEVKDAFTGEYVPLDPLDWRAKGR